MKQETESTEEIHLEGEKELRERLMKLLQQRKMTFITGWIHDILDDKCISSYLCVRALASAVSKSVIAVWCSRDASKISASESFPE